MDYVLGLAKNARLRAAIVGPQEPARPRDDETRQPAWVFAEVRSQRRASWSRARGVVAPAEPRDQGVNPRFVVPSLEAEQRPAWPLSEQDDCGRDAAETRLKEPQVHRFAARTRARPRRANPIRLFFAALASLLGEAWRRWAWPGRSWPVRRARRSV